MAGLRQHWPRVLYRTLGNHTNGPTRTTKPDVPTQHSYTTPETWCYSLPSKTKRWPDTRWIMSHHITEHGLQTLNTDSSRPSRPGTGGSSSKKPILLRPKEHHSGSRLHSTWSSRTLWDNRLFTHLCPCDFFRVQTCRRLIVLPISYHRIEQNLIYLWKKF